MMSCLEVQTQDPLLPNHSPCRCNPRRLEDTTELQQCWYVHEGYTPWHHCFLAAFGLMSIGASVTIPTPFLNGLAWLFCSIIRCMVLYLIQSALLSSSSSNTLDLKILTLTLHPKLICKSQITI